MESTVPPIPAVSAKEWRGLALALGVGVALRLAYVLALRAHPGFDAPAMDGGYHWAWARALAEGREFQDGPFFRAPLYPLWLGALVALLGDASTLGPRLVQSLLGGATVLGTWVVARRVAWRSLPPDGPWRGAALAAAGLVAVSWSLVAYDAELLIPTLLVPLVMLCLARALVALAAPGPGQAALAGAALGLAAIARPNVLLFAPVLLLMLGRRGGLRAAAALLAGLLLPIVPVTVHNVLEGDATLVATQGGVNLWIGNHAGSDGATAVVPGTRGGWWEGFHDATRLAEAAEGRALAPTEVSAHYLGRVAGRVRDDPAGALAQLGWKVRLFFNDAEIGNNTDPRFVAFHFAPWLRLSPVRFGWLAAAGLVGLLLAARRTAEGRLLLAFVLIYALSVVLFFVNARFRLPVVPPLAIGAALLGSGSLAAWRRGAWRAAIRPLLAAAALAALFALPPPGLRDGGAAGRLDLARAELAAGRAPAAVALLEAALERDPSNPYARVALAAALQRTGDPARAVRLLEETRRLLGGDLPEVRAQLVDALVDDGAARRALEVADEALGRDPSQPGLRFGRARALGALGDAAGARRDLERVLAEEPSAAHAALALGQLEAALGRAEAARLAFERVLLIGDRAPPELAAAARRALAGG